MAFCHVVIAVVVSFFYRGTEGAGREIPRLEWGSWDRDSGSLVGEYSTKYIGFIGGGGGLVIGR